MPVSYYRNFQIVFNPNPRPFEDKYGAFFNGKWTYAPNRVEIERAVDKRINKIFGTELEELRA
jgi:hypothetical protein